MLCADSFVAARTMSEPAAERRFQSQSVACLLLGMLPRDQHSMHRIGRRGGQSAHLMRIAPASPFTSTTRSFSKSCDQFYLAKMFSLADISQYSFSNIDIHCFSLQTLLLTQIPNCIFPELYRTQRFNSPVTRRMPLVVTYPPWTRPYSDEYTCP